mmetsp:Transcript_36452/g.54428  ORF Transcript_36452/g.54428 Transcript_36452/m.54428 type:complete len:90 (-) Transcript_36452:31-300(-)
MPQSEGDPASPQRSKLSQFHRRSNINHLRGWEVHLCILQTVLHEAMRPPCLLADDAVEVNQVTTGTNTGKMMMGFVLITLADRHIWGRT